MTSARTPSDMAEHQAVLDATADTERTMRPQSVPVNVYETTGGRWSCWRPCRRSPPTTSPSSSRGRPSVLRPPAQLGEREYLVKEWEYGGYERTVAIPDGYAGGLEASLANGQLADPRPAGRLGRGHAGDPHRALIRGRSAPRA